MSGKKTVIWTLLLLVLGGFYYLYEIRGAKSRQEAAQQKERLVPLAADDVMGITIQRATETIRAVKRDAHWYLTEPLSGPGDDQKYRDMVRYLTDLRQLRLVDEHPATLAPFGLTPPTVEVQVQRRDQNTPLVLRLGEKNPTGSGFYAQVEGQTAIYLVSTAAKDMLDASLFDLRDKTVLAFEPAAVQEVQIIDDNATTIQVQRQDAAHWQLTVPVHAAADEKQVQALLRHLHEAKVQAFVAEEATELEPYGLHTPMRRLVLTLTPEGTTKTLWLGKADPERQGLYARRDKATQVLLLPQTWWENLPKTATALRDNTLLRYERDRIARLEMLSADERIVITRTGERQYQLEEPFQTAGDADTIYGLLGDLHELKAQDFVTEAPEQLTPYGLAPPRLRVTLWEEPVDKTAAVTQATLLFGGTAPAQKGMYVQLADRPTVYLVDGTAAQRILSKTAFALRDKKLLTFTPTLIHKVQLQYPTSTLTLERRGDAWQVSEPKQQPLTERWKVDDLLHTLSTAEYTRLLEEPAADAARYGLDMPQVRITLWPKDGSPIGPLVLGKILAGEGQDGKEVYAQKGETLYTTTATLWEALPKNVGDLATGK